MKIFFFIAELVITVVLLGLLINNLEFKKDENRFRYYALILGLGFAALITMFVLTYCMSLEEMGLLIIK